MTANHIAHFLQEANNSQARAGRFLFDELFGIDITGGVDTEEERLRNCTCGKTFISFYGGLISSFAYNKQIIICKNVEIPNKFWDKI